MLTWKTPPLHKEREGERGGEGLAQAKWSTRGTCAFGSMTNWSTQGNPALTVDAPDVLWGDCAFDCHAPEVAVVDHDGVQVVPARKELSLTQSECGLPSFLNVDPNLDKVTSFMGGDEWGPGPFLGRLASAGFVKEVKSPSRVL